MCCRDGAASGAFESDARSARGIQALGGMSAAMSAGRWRCLQTEAKLKPAACAAAAQRRSTGWIVSPITCPCLITLKTSGGSRGGGHLGEAPAALRRPGQRGRRRGAVAAHCQLPRLRPQAITHCVPPGTGDAGAARQVRHVRQPVHYQRLRPKTNIGREVSSEVQEIERPIECTQTTCIQPCLRRIGIR